MQLNREELIKAYQGMCRIREFEDAVHEEFASGALPGFVPVSYTHLTLPTTPYV